MIKAYKIFTGDDNNTHLECGSVYDNILTGATSIRFRETSAHAVYEWHTAPAIQYVLSLTGVLEFELRNGQKFTLYPGEVLIAMDITGTGHRWQLVNDEPWKRAYITFDENAPINFIPEK